MSVALLKSDPGVADDLHAPQTHAPALMEVDMPASNGPSPATTGLDLPVSISKNTTQKRSDFQDTLQWVGRNVIPPLIMTVLVMMLWQILCSSPNATLPSPTRIWADAHDLIVHPFFNYGSQDIGLGWRVGVSLQRVSVGFGFAIVVGVFLGAIVGQSDWAMRGLDPLFQILRTVPPLAWLPIALAAFRDSRPSAIFVIFITSIWPILINTAVGIRNIPQDYRNVAAVLRLNPAEFFVKIMLPSAAPYIFTGLRIGIGLAWLAIVAAEMLTGGVGIGFFIWDAWNSSRIADIIVALFYIGLVGFVLDHIVGAIGNLVARGSGNT